MEKRKHAIHLQAYSFERKRTVSSTERDVIVKRHRKTLVDHSSKHVTKKRWNV